MRLRVPERSAAHSKAFPPRPLGFALLLCFAVLGPLDRTCAQTLDIRRDPPSSSGTIPVGQDFGSRIGMFTGGEEIIGWRFTVEVDPTMITLLSVEMSPAVATINNGQPPEFQSIDVGADRFSVSALACTSGCSGIESTVYVTLYSFECNALTLGNPSICIVPTPASGGTPAIPVELDTPLGTIAPATSCRIVPVLEHAEWEFSLSDALVEYPGASGEAEFSVVASIGQYPLGSHIAESPSFVMGVAHDPALIEGVSVVPAGPVAAIPGGPDYFQFELHPNGVTLGVLFSLIGLVTIQFPGETPAARFDYRTVPSGLQGVAGDTTTTVEFSNDLGIPPVFTFINPGDSSIPPFPFPGTITFVPLPPNNYVRGDANDDALVDLADAIAILAYLFSAAEAPFCLTAADANADGALDLGDPIQLLNFLFEGGAPPSAPYPACGFAEFDDCPEPGASCP